MALPAAPRRPRKLLSTVVAAAAVLTLTAGAVACSSAAKPETLTVFAAASLQNTFTTIAEEFTQDSGVEVSFSFEGSSTLAQNLNDGAQADIFASADEPNLEKVRSLLEGNPTIFAANVLSLAVAPGNPLGIEGLHDLYDVRLVTCAPQVPCGSATQRLSQAQNVSLSPVSEEQKVTDVLGKVRSGEADAGVVYRTDVIGAGDAVTGVEIEGADAVVNKYPIGLLQDAHPRAQEFIDWVLSERGQEILRTAGFLPAPGA